MKTTFIIPILLCALVTTVHAQQPQLVYDTWGGYNGCTPAQLTPFNNKLYFQAVDALHGRELWVYDGINPPAMVYDLNPGQANGCQYVPINAHMAVLNGKLYFQGDDGNTGEELYIYDGINPPSLAVDIVTGPGSSIPQNFVTIGNNIYFSASTSSTGRELYSYNGVNPPTLIGDINPGIYNSSSIGMTEFNGKVYFAASNANGGKLYFYDPSVGTYGVAVDTVAGLTISLRSLPVKGNNKLYFVGHTSLYGSELYGYDGVTVTRITDLAPGTKDGVLSGSQLAYLNGYVYFSGGNDSINFQLYKLNTTSNSASFVYQINPSLLTVYKNNLYFAAIDTLGEELWKTDGTTAFRLANIAYGSLNSDPSEFFVWNGRLYFAATSDITGTELYSLYDPTGIRDGVFSNDVIVYPNPVTDRITLHIKTTITTNIVVQLTDIDGRKVYKSSTTLSPRDCNLSIPASNLSPGIYFYQVLNIYGEKIAMGKLVKR